MKAKHYDVSKYQGYVRAITLFRYRRLPEYIKGSIGVDDCVQDGLLYLHSVINRLENNRVAYDSRRAKIETWIFKIIESYFGKLVQTHCRKQRMTVLVPLDQLKIEFGLPERTTALIRVHEAQDRVRNMHRLAPPHLIDFIADNLYFPTSTRIKLDRTAIDYRYVKNPYTRGLRKIPLTKAEIFKERKREFLVLARQANVTVEDYLLALRAERPRTN